MSRATVAGIFAPNSEQTVGTPAAFLTWVKAEFGHISCDMAASLTNRMAERYYGPDHIDPSRRDALGFTPWPSRDAYPADEGWLWCNPPFRLAGKFAAKAHSEGYPTLLLVPASVGANWWRDYVYDKADVHMVGRLWFEGHSTPFPKDLALVVYQANGMNCDNHWSYPRLTSAQRGKPPCITV